MNEPGEAALADLSAQATVDCCSEDEELAGLAAMTGETWPCRPRRRSPA